MTQFVPLECNPQVFNQLLQLMDVKRTEFQDVWSLEDEMLTFIPRPVLAVLLVFPVSEAYEKYRTAADADVQDYDLCGDAEPAMWYKQTIGNACGTMALLHAIANAVPPENLGGLAKQIVDDTRNLNPQDRAKYLETCKGLADAHAQVAGQGDTEAPDATADIDFHYVCLAQKDGQIYELDGRRKGAICRGPADGSDPRDVLCPRGLAVIKEFMDRESGNSFSMLAMTEDAGN